MPRTRRSRRRVVGALVLLVIAAVLVQRHAGSESGAGGGLPGAELPARLPAAAGADQLVIEPDDGMSLIYRWLSAPRRTLDLTMYELADPTAESLLADDAARGVRVRVILDGRLVKRRNEPAYDYLRSRGVEVRWSSDRYAATHEKAFVVDESTAVVMSLNLTSRYYATTRDVAVVDRDPHDVAATERVFTADLSGRSVGTPAADDLVWSPGQSQSDLVAMIGAARRSILVESEEFSSEPVLNALTAAARRGVRVTVAMTYQSEWARGFDAVERAGGHVAVMHGERPVYVHAKVLVVDPGTSNGRAFVGSENLSDASLRHDRELGLVLVSPGLVQRLASLVETDARSATPWSA